MSQTEPAGDSWQLATHLAQPEALDSPWLDRCSCPQAPFEPERPRCDHRASRSGPIWPTHRGSQAQYDPTQAQERWQLYDWADQDGDEHERVADEGDRGHPDHRLGVAGGRRKHERLSIPVIRYHLFQ